MVIKDWILHWGGRGLDPFPYLLIGAKKEKKAEAEVVPSSSLVEVGVEVEVEVGVGIWVGVGVWVEVGVDGSWCWSTTYI